jgi:hypothetical protein
MFLLSRARHRKICLSATSRETLKGSRNDAKCSMKTSGLVSYVLTELVDQIWQGESSLSKLNFTCPLGVEGSVNVLNSQKKVHDSTVSSNVRKVNVPSVSMGEFLRLEPGDQVP